MLHQKTSKKCFVKSNSRVSSSFAHRISHNKRTLLDLLVSSEHMQTIGRSTMSICYMSLCRFVGIMFEAVWLHTSDVPKRISICNLNTIFKHLLVCPFGVWWHASFYKPNARDIRKFVCEQNPPIKSFDPKGQVGIDSTLFIHSLVLLRAQLGEVFLEILFLGQHWQLNL